MIYNIYIYGIYVYGIHNVNNIYRVIYTYTYGILYVWCNVCFLGIAMVQSSSGQSAEFDGCQMSFRCVYQACQCRHLGHIGGMNGTEPTSCQQEKVAI